MDIEHIIYPGGGMNPDASVDTIPDGDYLEAWNILHRDTDQVGTVVNARGIDGKAVNLPAGPGNRVIGFCEDKEDLTGYYFVYNPSDNHCIVRYNSESDTFEFIIYSASILNFSTSNKIKASIIGSGVNKLLYWTDGRNRPRKLNITRAYRLTNTTTSTTTTTTTT
jgi:hypothetical protein